MNEVIYYGEIFNISTLFRVSDSLYRPSYFRVSFLFNNKLKAVL